MDGMECHGGDCVVAMGRRVAEMALSPDESRRPLDCCGCPQLLSGGCGGQFMPAVAILQGRLMPREKPAGPCTRKAADDRSSPKAFG